MNLAHALVRAARTYPARPAIAVGQNITATYAHLAHRSAALATTFNRTLGLKPGDRVALITANCSEYIEIMFAAWHDGLIIVPVNAKLHRDEYHHILADTGARLCFSSTALIDELAAIKPDTCQLIEICSPDYAALFDAPAAPLADAAPDDIAWIFYTSGTTGMPKGACLSHRNLATMCYCYFADVDPTPPWRAILHAAPMSHGSGLYGLAYVMQAGLHIIPSGAGFDPDEIFDLADFWPGTSFFAAPTMVRRLTQHSRAAPRALRSISYGGGPMHVEDCLAALDKFGPKLTQLYGQGESPMTITALNAAAHIEDGKPAPRARLGSVGIAQSAVQVRTVGADGAHCDICEIGEIIVRGDSVMRGYWRNPEATAKTIRNGWLYTGDMGSFDAHGYLTLKDRSKDVIISGGQNIYPREIEEVLLRHPGVAEVAVIGRADREWGERVEAVLVKTPGSGAAAEELDQFCLQHLARFKRPKTYRFVDALPKNNTGKVLKRTLRDGP
ncbi:MAG: AMP-binding protein [Pseudomonadota bacterium]